MAINWEGITKQLNYTSIPEMLKSEHLKHRSTEKLAEFLGVSTMAITECKRRYKVSFPFLYKYREEIKKLSGKGLTMMQVANLVGCCSAHVCKMKTLYDLDFKPAKKGRKS